MFKKLTKLVIVKIFLIPQLKKPVSTFKMTIIKPSRTQYREI